MCLAVAVSLLVRRPSERYPTRRNRVPMEPPAARWRRRRSAPACGLQRRPGCPEIHPTRSSAAGALKKAQRAEPRCWGRRPPPPGQPRASAGACRPRPVPRQRLRAARSRPARFEVKVRQRPCTDPGQLHLAEVERSPPRLRGEHEGVELVEELRAIGIVRLWWLTGAGGRGHNQRGDAAPYARCRLRSHFRRLRGSFRSKDINCRSWIAIPGGNGKGRTRPSPASTRGVTSAI